MTLLWAKKCTVQTFLCNVSQIRYFTLHSISEFILYDNGIAILSALSSYCRTHSADCPHSRGSTRIVKVKFYKWTYLLLGIEWAVLKTWWGVRYGTFGGRTTGCSAAHIATRLLLEWDSARFDEIITKVEVKKFRRPAPSGVRNNIHLKLHCYSSSIGLYELVQFLYLRSVPAHAWNT